MDDRSRMIARGGMMTALSVVLLYLASIVPSGQIGFCAAAGVIPAMPLSVKKVHMGVLVYAATALVGFFILPSKTMAIFYTAFFGCYTFVKYAVERLRNRPLEWALKLVFCNLAAAAAFLMLRYGFFSAANVKNWPWIAFFAAVNIVFIAYDIAFSKLIGLLQRLMIRK